MGLQPPPARGCDRCSPDEHVQHVPVASALFSNDVLQQWRKIWISDAGARRNRADLLRHQRRPERRRSGLAIYVVLFSALIGVAGWFTDQRRSSRTCTIRCRARSTSRCRARISSALSAATCSPGRSITCTRWSAYAIFDAAAALYRDAHRRGARAARLRAFLAEDAGRHAVLLGPHALVFGGAIYFRSHALIKTALFAVIAWLGLAVLWVGRCCASCIWDHFTTLLPNESAARFQLHRGAALVHDCRWSCSICGCCSLRTSACASTRCSVNFKPNYSIYLQVADFVCEKVLTGVWRDGDKLPAVKDLAVLTAVNPNTVIKALTWLQDNEILSTQRGVGYFLTEGAASKTLALKRREFIEEDLPDVFASMQLLGVDLDELDALYQNYRKQAAERRPT